MLANNPHLQKKRSSKKGLGRSLMRRITEIPETVRQCSREDKDSGDHSSSNRNSICALRKNPFDPSSHTTKPAKEESLRSKVFSLKKSHSSYDHVRDQSEDSSSSATDKMEASTTESSLLDTLMGKKLVKKKSSEKIDSTSESTESMPLVCKSASAHNLTADKKPLHPRTSMLQKSLSVIASAKEKTLGLAAKAEDASKKAPPKAKEAKIQGESEEKLENSSKLIISQSVEYKQPTAKAGIMKQPASGSQPSISTDPAKNKELYDLSEVCPWELEDLPTPSEGKVQKHVSIAPDETTTVHGKSTSVPKAQQQQQQQKKKTSEPSPSSNRRPNQKPVERADICPWEEASESPNQMEGSRPALSGQPPVPAGSAETSKTQKAEVCPWDYEDTAAKPADPGLLADKGRERGSASSSDGKRKGTTPTDVKGKGNTLVEAKGKSTTSMEAKGKGANPTDYKGKSAALAQPTTSKADVCPWDYDLTPAKSPSTEKTPSLTQVSKTKESSSKTKGTGSMRTLEKEVEKEREKAKEAEDDKSKMKGKDKLPSVSKPTEKPTSQSKMAEVCPWDIESSEDVLTVEKRRSANVGSAKSKQADVCPWDFQEPSDSRGTSKSPVPSVTKQKSPSPRGDVSRADVCPWDFDDSTSGKKA